MDDLLGSDEPVYNIQLSTTDFGEALGAFDNFYDPSPGVFSSECDYCGITMQISETGTHLICPDCGLKVEYEEQSSAVNTSTNIRIVGNMSGKFQKDLYKSADMNTKELQRDKIFHEILSYCKKYEDEKRESVPKDVVGTATDLYLSVRTTGVRRSDNKRKMLAAVYHCACLEKNIQLPAKTIACIFNLKSLGISDGIRVLHKLVKTNVIASEDITLDPLNAAICTIFRQMGIDDEGLKSEVKRIIITADQKNIGISSSLDSKIVGATNIVLTRNNIKMDMKKISALRGIRQATIQKYIDFVNDRISNFYPEE